MAQGFDPAALGAAAKGRYTTTMSENQANAPAAQPPADNGEEYLCVGVCMADPESGLCQGCGRPLAEPQTPETDGPA